MGFFDTEEKDFNLEAKSDEEILALSLKHPHVFEEIIKRLEAPFMRKATSILYNKEEAEDMDRRIQSELNIPDIQYVFWGQLTISRRVPPTSKVSPQANEACG